MLFKWAVYALLAGNVALYASAGTATEAIDTAAWVLLLLLFEWETGDYRQLPRWSCAVLRLLRGVAGLAVLWACVDYAIDGERLDFANAATWLAVVLALELELRLPPGRSGLQRARQFVAWGLYAALGCFAALWWGHAVAGDRGALLDAWDASLWLAAFVVIELNVFGLAGAGGSARWVQRGAAASS